MSLDYVGHESRIATLAATQFTSLSFGTVSSFSHGKARLELRLRHFALISRQKYESEIKSLYILKVVISFWIHLLLAPEKPCKLSLERE